MGSAHSIAECGDATRAEPAFSRVVCPLDGGAAAERAVPSALDVADRFGASVELFSAVEDPHLVARRRRYLDDLVEGCGSATGREMFVNVVVDPHAPRALAERSNDDAVVTVMTTSSQPLLHAGYLGSAAERTAREASNATLLIGPRNTVRLGDVDRVVVPCDGSPLSEGILVDARSWADRLGVPMWIVSNVDPATTRHPAFRPAAESNLLRRLATEHDAQWEVLHGPDTAKAIAQWAGTGLIAMTTHGRSGFSRLTVGSVTTAVTRWASGPVLVANRRRSLRSIG